MAARASDHRCLVCASDDLAAVAGFETLSRVTSDSKPWPAGGRLSVCGQCGAMQKLVDDAWREEIGRIYGAYDIYHQSGGAEQPIFAGGGAPVARSERILETIGQHIALGPDLAVLDFGCGTGSALRTYAAHHPGWALHGAELSTRSLARLKTIPGFVELYTCPPGEISRTFELVTAIHAMEHVTDPVGTMAALATRLAPGGHLVVQVPDCGASPYDLAIADHLTHFTLTSLRLAAERAGLEILFASDAVLSKELTLLARAGGQSGAVAENGRGPGLSEAPMAWPAAQGDAETGRRLAENGVAWLAAQVEAARRIGDAGGKLGIFGTSISATWLDGALGHRADFFVDEDPGRIGREHFGRPILSPADVEADADVYVPLIPAVAAAVAGRHAGTARYHEPPPLVSRLRNF